MLLRYIVLSIATAVLSLSVYTEAQNCQNNFVVSLYQCLGNRSLDRDNFLWLTRNGTLGKEPADIQSFTSRACLEKPGLVTCVRTALNNSLSQPEEQCSEEQKSSLTSLFKGIFRNLNAKCRDPCRRTFADNLAKCYTDKSFTDPDLRLFNITTSRDAILGQNKTQIDQFCQERDSIIECLKTKALDCSDATFMLRSFSLDFEALNETYHTLCNYSNVYLDQVTCFKDPGEMLTTCRRAVNKFVAELEMDLADFNITETQYFEEMCRLRMDQIQCEKAAISRHLNSTCPSAVLGLRTQQECMLVPLDCRLAKPAKVASLCRMADFRIPERQSYKSGAKSSLMFLDTHCQIWFIALSWFVMTLVAR